MKTHLNHEFCIKRFFFFFYVRVVRDELYVQELLFAKQSEAQLNAKQCQRDGTLT